MSQTLYRFWDADGALLYFGISVRPWDRWKQHAGEKPWWDEVAKVTLEAFATRDEVRAAELAAIKGEGPRFNIADMPREEPVDGWDGTHVPGDLACSCGADVTPEEFSDHVITAVLGEAFAVARHQVKPERSRRASVKFVKDAWPEYMQRHLHRNWQQHAREWLDSGATRDDVREAMRAAQSAYLMDRTETPWNYAGGVVRRLIREKSGTPTPE